MQLHIGVSSDRGSLKRFSFDLLEMPISPALPKAKTLREMRASRPNLKFSLRLHPDAALVGAEHPDVVRAAVAAEALGAEVVVIPTGPRFTPTSRNREILKKMATALGAEGRQVAWEPRGVWAPEEADGIAVELGLLLVRDLTREAAPSGDTVYTRLLPFGFGARLSQNSLEVLTAHLETIETAYVIVQADGAKRTRSELREWFEMEGD